MMYLYRFTCRCGCVSEHKRRGAQDCIRDPIVCPQCNSEHGTALIKEKLSDVPDIPDPPSPPATGVKHDQSKPRWDLLPIRETEEVVHVLTFGAVKYADDNWKKVDNSRNRYFAALMRHITAWWSGETFDPETKRHHLAHAVCCCMFLMWFDLEKTK